MKTWIAIVAVLAQVFCLTGAGWARPFTRIVSPVQDQCVPGPDVTVKFEAGGMTLGASAWNLHFMLDNEPFQIQYDGNHAHVFKNVRPGSHTVRVYAANAMQEAIPGTQSTVSFSVAYADKANYVMPGSPTLTYNLPQGEYFGIDAADITVDFLLENAVVAPGGYQVAYYVDGRRFLIQDQCGPRHVKNLNPGLHRVRIELQNQFGDLVPGAFNSTERSILISPSRVTKSPSTVDDGYHGLPRLDSIKGSMTMGQHWSATAPVEPLSQADIEKQASLTVRNAKGERVGVREGRVLNPLDAATDADPIETPAKQFTVRAGGEPDSETMDLDEGNASNVLLGTVFVDNSDDDDEDVESETTATVVNNADAETPVAKSAVKATTRRRADGTSTTVIQTTATQRLADRPGMRTVETQTSRTVYPSGNLTTATKQATKQTTETLTKPESKQTTETGKQDASDKTTTQALTRRTGNKQTSETGTSGAGRERKAGSRRETSPLLPAIN